ncbi:MAG TPA: M24 family metallopeptidase [Candidatus Binataceae bacterium]
MATVEEIAAALRESAIDGWLFCDFRRSDPIAYRLLGLSDDLMTTRRWFYYLPAHGKPQALVSAVEAHRLDSLPGEKLVYRRGEEIPPKLAQLTSRASRIALNYSPRCAIPYVSRVDGGTLEIVLGLGVEVVSAADLIQRFEAPLTGAGISSHRRAVAELRTIVDESFAYVARTVRAGKPISELALQEFVMSNFASRNLTTDHPPIVAAAAHSADPHFAPSAAGDLQIKPGDLLLLDLWAKEKNSDSAYGDLTWMAYVGDRVPDEYARIFSVVGAARDAAVGLIQRRVSAGEPVAGRDADGAARAVIAAAGFAEFFLHRTGHSIGREVHGNGANLDSFETDDYRNLLDRTCFSVEPGIYLVGRFGIRSEIDMVIDNGAATVSAGAIQSRIVPLLR